MEVCQLVTTFTEFHGGSPLYLIGLFIQKKSIICNHSSNLILLQLSSNKEYLVLCLNASEALWNDFRISNCDCCRVLSGKLVNKHLLKLLVKVVETGLLSLQNKIGLK